MSYIDFNISIKYIRGVRCGEPKISQNPYKQRKVEILVLSIVSALDKTKTSSSLSKKEK